MLRIVCTRPSNRNFSSGSLRSPVKNLLLRAANRKFFFGSLRSPNRHNQIVLEYLRLDKPPLMHAKIKLQLRDRTDGERRLNL